jgi:hypothetical protein
LRLDVWRSAGAGRWVGVEVDALRLKELDA